MRILDENDIEARNNCNTCVGNSDCNENCIIFDKGICADDQAYQEELVEALKAAWKEIKRLREGVKWQRVKSAGVKRT